MKIYKKHFSFITGLILALIGILSIILLNRITTRVIMSERDEQLFSLAYSVDQNITQKMDEMKNALAFILRNENIPKMEKQIETTGNYQEYIKVFENSHLFEKEALEGVVLLNNEMEQLFSLNQNDGRTDHIYTFIADADQDDLFVCHDEEGKYSIALEKQTDNYGYRYYALLDLNHFYDMIIPEQLQQSSWVVFYEETSGLSLQNHDNQDPWLILTEQEILDRNDGYTIIMKNQKAETKGAETYMYPNYNKVNVKERIVTLPQSMTLNGYFAIGISKDSEVLYQELNSARDSVIVIMLLLLASGIFITQYIFQYRQHIINTQKEMEAARKEKEMQAALLEAQLQNSIHQLQPHFLYNSLSSIREIVLETPEYAADLLFDFTQFLRACLQAISSKEMIPFEQELKNIQAYINIEKMRLGDRLTVIMDIQESNFDIIPLGIQPLVENAIRHGISKKRNKTGTVWIRTGKTEDYIEISVEDNGIGFDVEKIKEEVLKGTSNSTGIRNFTLRFENKMNAKVNCSSEIGKGTKITIKIPITR